MNVFQGMVLMLFSLLAALTLSATIRGMVRKRVAAIWLLLWILGGVAIVWPRSTFLLARWLGIGRGTDLVLYVSVLIMLVGFFYVYGRFRRLDRQLTVLVRQLAIEQAERTQALPSAPARDLAVWSKDSS